MLKIMSVTSVIDILFRSTQSLVNYLIPKLLSAAVLCYNLMSRVNQKVRKKIPSPVVETWLQH
jgi:hypothetical protein